METSQTIFASFVASLPALRANIGTLWVEAKRSADASSAELTQAIDAMHDALRLDDDTPFDPAMLDTVGEVADREEFLVALGRYRAARDNHREACATLEFTRAIERFDRSMAPTQADRPVPHRDDKSLEWALEQFRPGGRLRAVGQEFIDGRAGTYQLNLALLRAADDVGLWYVTGHDVAAMICAHADPSKPLYGHAEPGARAWAPEFA